jgi:outer membrane protein assembly factor BamB
LIAGLPLDEIVRLCGPLPEATVWHIGAGMATAIADIHAAKLAHRDLKPDNVLVAINGPWVIDLGLAHLAGARHRRTSGLPIGPWHYAAPEWWKGGGIKATGTPADIYGLGAVLLLAATGHPPYPASVTPGQVESSPPDLRDLPSGPLGRLIESCLMRDETRRPVAEAVRQDFRSGTGGAGRAAFADILPEPAMNMLVEHLNDLAALTGTWGPSELGWGPPREESVRKRKRKSPSPIPNEDWNVAWTYEVEGWIRGPLAVHGDLVVAASLDGSVAALRTARDGTSATAAWDEPVRTGAALQAGPLVIPDGMRAGTAYVGDAAGIVHGIDLASGRMDTVLQAGTAIEDTPVLVRGSIPGPGDSAVIVKRLYALTVDGWLHSVDLEIGAPKLLYRMGNPATGTLTTSSGLIIAAGADGSVQAIDAFTGTRAWPLATDGQVLAPPLGLGSWLYVCGTDGVVRKVDVEDGRTAAIAEVDGPVHCALVGDAYRIYVAGCDGMIRAYDVGHPSSERMDLAWEEAVDDEVTGLAVTSTAVYVSAGRRLIELDRMNGDVTRKPFEMRSLISAAPVISGPNCYVARLDGVVMCLSLT